MVMKSINKNLLIILTIVIFVFICSSIIYLKSEKQTKKPNLILISIDTLRADHMGIYGYKKNTTPNIDKWAKESGFIFTNAYTTTPITYPSFATFMTGVSPFNSQIYNHGTVHEDENGVLHKYSGFGNPEISDNSKTLAEILKSNGYSTSAFILNSVLRNKGTGMGRGFDSYNVAGNNYSVVGPNYQGIILDTQEWIENQKNPFFLWIHFLDPHSEYTPREEFQCKFNKEHCKEIAKNGVKFYGDQVIELDGCHLKPLPQKIVSLQETLYDGEIAQTDELVGRLIKFIKEKELDKNTIIVLYADHGEGFDHNYYFTHSEVLYESAVKVPFIISHPKLNGKGKNLPQIISNVSMSSTILSLIGIQNNSDKFSSLLLDDLSKIEEEPIYFVNQSATKFAIRKGKYKFIYTSNPIGSSCLAKEKDELYDLEKDPQELRNIAHIELRIRDELKGNLLDHIDSFLYQKTKNEQLQFKNNSTEDDQEVLKKIQELGY